MSMRDRCTDGVNRKTTVEANAVKSTDDSEIREDRLQMNDSLFMPVNRWTAWLILEILFIKARSHNWLNKCALCIHALKFLAQSVQCGKHIMHFGISRGENMHLKIKNIEYNNNQLYLIIPNVLWVVHRMDSCECPQYLFIFVLCKNTLDRHLWCCASCAFKKKKLRIIWIIFWTCMWVFVTLYPWIFPFCVSMGGGCHSTSSWLEDTDFTWIFWGATEGAVNTCTKLSFWIEQQTNQTCMCLDFHSWTTIYFIDYLSHIKAKRQMTFLCDIMDSD